MLPISEWFWLPTRSELCYSTLDHPDSCSFFTLRPEVTLLGWQTSKSSNELNSSSHARLLIQPSFRKILWTLFFIPRSIYLEPATMTVRQTCSLFPIIYVFPQNTRYLESTASLLNSFRFPPRPSFLPTTPSHDMVCVCATLPQLT